VILQKMEEKLISHIYKNYLTDRDWYLGSVGQYTSFFTILGCVIGYPINQMWKNK
jgi:hypothetical protein